MTISASPPTGTVRDLLVSNATKAPNAAAYSFTDGSAPLTWVDLEQGSQKIAKAITSLGVQKGDSIAIIMPNGRDAVLAFFGTVYGGFRATMINLAAGDEAINYALGHCEARFAFVGQSQVDQFERTKPVGMVAVDLNALAIDADLHKVAPSDHALLMYTSGTTGRPKGVLHSNASLLAGGWTTALAHELSAEDCGYCVLPMCHINGLCVTVMGTLVSSGQLVIAPKFSTRQFWTDIETSKVTWFSVVPTIISHLLHGEATPPQAVKDLLRFGRSASAPLAPDVQTAFEDRFDVPIVETMGLTETAAQILSNPLPPGLRKIGSPGVAIGNEAGVLNKDGKIAVPNEEGEIVIRGANVMLGYLKNQSATDQAFTPDGWFRTGDLGKQDQDGYFFVTGRLKELIIKGGENIAPREIDEALYADPDVVEAAAFSVPCSIYGERVEAAVTLKDGSAKTTDQLLQGCIKRLGSFKAPDTIFMLDELPKGPSGKIQRRLVAEAVGKLTSLA